MPLPRGLSFLELLSAVVILKLLCRFFFSIIYVPHMPRALLANETFFSRPRMPRAVEIAGGTHGASALSLLAE